MLAQMISVVIPTVKGREALLKKCVDAYKATTPDLDLIVVRGAKSCGIAWQRGARRAKGDYLHFTADDLIPMPGWAEAAVEVSAAGAIPGARVLTAWDENEVWDTASAMYAGCYLRGNRLAQNVLVPFLSRALLARGDWLLPIHYGSDDWVTFLADCLQIPCPAVPAYELGHFAAPEGRLNHSRSVDIPILCDHMAVWGPVPHVYANMGLSYGWNANEAPAPNGPAAVLGDAPARIDEDPGYYWNGPAVVNA
jgi:hypothetical protein